MKFRIPLKTPDALRSAVEREVDSWLAGKDYVDKYSLRAIRDAMVDENMEACKRWFLYGEQVTIEICTDCMLASVVEVK